MSDVQERNGWNEWSKHIIKELERLNESSDKLRESIHNSNLEIAKLKGLEKDITELKAGIAIVKAEVEKSAIAFEGRVDGRIRALIKDIDNNVIDMKNSTEKIVERLTSLENYKAYTWGIGIAVLALISIIISILALFDWSSVGK